MINPNCECFVYWVYLITPFLRNIIFTWYSVYIYIHILYKYIYIYNITINTYTYLHIHSIYIVVYIPYIYIHYIIHGKNNANIYKVVLNMWSSCHSICDGEPGKRQEIVKKGVMWPKQCHQPSLISPFFMLVV